MWLLWAQLWCGDGRYPATDQRNHPASTLKGRPAGVAARRHADDFSPARWCDLTFFSLFSLKNQCTTRQKVCHLTLGRVCLVFSLSPSHFWRCCFAQVTAKIAGQTRARHWLRRSGDRRSSGCRDYQHGVGSRTGGRRVAARRLHVAGDVKLTANS